MGFEQISQPHSTGCEDHSGFSDWGLRLAWNHYSFCVRKEQNRIQSQERGSTL
jgi:hypothetical protein